MKANNLSLKDVVKCAVNALEAGVDSKEEAVSSILDFIDANYTANSALDVVPVEVFEAKDKAGNTIKVFGIPEHLIA
ncbi:hypothetical protein [Cellulosilyticum sp. I15G10I2]|uniref:hypothetical protein n=1 Tax=Cellulosilyticum sp. I15G10I2 TaxID=1892843 RepID=UPI00085CD06A|nr:hypothetical protein [Cellulosilyticum sp. I15G10I2]